MCVCVCQRVCAAFVTRLPSPVPPSIADEPTELVVTRLLPVVIGCTASGIPAPTVHWSKDGVKLSNQEEDYSILPSGLNDYFVC